MSVSGLQQMKAPGHPESLGLFLEVVRRAAKHAVEVTSQGLVLNSVVRLQVASSPPGVMRFPLVASVRVGETIGEIDRAVKQAEYGFARQVSAIMNGLTTYMLPLYGHDAETRLYQEIGQVSIPLISTRIPIEPQVQVGTDQLDLFIQLHQEVNE